MEPSRLKEYPVGITNATMRRGTPTRWKIAVAVRRYSIFSSIVGQPPGTIAEPEREVQDLGYRERAGEFARRFAAHLVQCNWPVALNTPDQRYQGESKAYAPDGEVLLTLPRDQAGVAVFNLGERDYHWTPLAA